MCFRQLNSLVPCAGKRWRPRRPMTAAVKTMTRMTLLIGWYPAPAVPSFTMLCRSAWPNTRTGECARARSRLSKTAWWISKTHGTTSWGGSTQRPFNPHPAELNLGCGVWHTWHGMTIHNLVFRRKPQKPLIGHEFSSEAIIIGLRCKVNFSVVQCTTWCILSQVNLKIKKGQNGSVVWWCLFSFICLKRNISGSIQSIIVIHF